MELAYLLPRIRPSGWLIVDDIQIPSVYELFQFLRREPAMKLEEVVVRTAFFRLAGAAGHGPDGWSLQGINHRTIWRYSWRDRLRRLLGRS